jgi:8-oxo-dGTP diphosphatase
MFIVNVEGAIFREDRWLIVKRSAQESHAAGTLALVGGKVEDEGNSVGILERTLIREIDEEVGVRVKEPLRYVRSTSFMTDDGYRVVDVVFLCEYAGGDARNKCPDEVDEVYWLTYEEIIGDPDCPVWLRDNLEQAVLIRQGSQSI